MKGPAETGQICTVGRRKIAKKIAKNKRWLCADTLRPRSRMLLKVMKTGVRGVIPPWVILGGGWINLSVTGNGGPPPKVIPEGRPPPPSFTGMIVVTGNGDLPLATQRRVESIASDRSPFAVA